MTALGERRCAVCGRTTSENIAARHRDAGITRTFGIWAHPPCFRRAQRLGWIVWGARGEPARIERPPRGKAT